MRVGPPPEDGGLGGVVVGVVVLGHRNGQPLGHVPAVLGVQGQLVILGVAGDKDLAEEIERRTGIRPQISQNSFLGGIRAVIPEKNILIDYTFNTLLEAEKENLNFDGGLKHE